MNGIQGLDVDPDSLSPYDLVADHRWATRCTAINVQADIAPNARLAIGELQQRLSQNLPGQHPIPAKAMHASVLNLIHSRSDDADESKERVWRRSGDRWRRGMAEVAVATSSFEVRLSHVVITPAGIIVAASACPEMVELRRRLAAACGLTCDVSRLCHVTVLRFGPTPPRLVTVQGAVRQLRIDVVAPISTIRLVRELVYPSLERQTILEAELSGPRSDDGGRQQPNGVLDTR